MRLLIGDRPLFLLARRLRDLNKHLASHRFPTPSLRVVESDEAPPEGLFQTVRHRVVLTVPLLQSGHWLRSHRNHTHRPVCGACSKRRHSHVCVIVDGAGVEHHIGNTCLAEFIGVPRVSQQSMELARGLGVRIQRQGHDGWLEMLVDLAKQADEAQRAPNPPRPATEVFAAWAAAARRLQGSLTQPGDTTAMAAYEALAAQAAGTVPQFRPSLVDHGTAHRALGWARQLSASDTAGDDYLEALRVAVQRDFVPHDELGLVGSVVNAHGRNIARVGQSQASRHLGLPGDQVEIDARVIALRQVATDWGLRTVVELECGNGEICVHWSADPGPLRVGERVRAEATVKRHSIYRGVAQTVLGRLRLTDARL